MGKKQRKIKQIWLIITQSTWQILFEWPFPRITYRKEQSHVQRWHRSLFSTAAQRNIFFLWKRKMHVYVVCEKFWKKYWLVTGCIYKHHLYLMCCTFEFDWMNHKADYISLEFLSMCLQTETPWLEMTPCGHCFAILLF